MWRDQCLAHGILACHSEPVIGSGGAQLASLMLCFDTPRTPSDWESRIALVGARLLTIAIERRTSGSWDPARKHTLPAC